MDVRISLRKATKRSSRQARFAPSTSIAIRLPLKASKAHTVNKCVSIRFSSLDRNDSLAFLFRLRLSITERAKQKFCQVSSAWSSTWAGYQVVRVAVDRNLN